MALESISNGINSHSDLSSSSFPCSPNGYLSGDQHGTLEEDRLMPIAIIGFSMKFPQDATSPDAFWKMLTERKCAMTDLPTDRAHIDAFYHPDGNRRDTNRNIGLDEWNTRATTNAFIGEACMFSALTNEVTHQTSSRGGHFLEEPISLFDAPFFGIPSVEAAAMDPQQRGILETAYRAFENAGIPLSKVFDSNTSVHTGCFSDDYKSIVCKDPELLPKYASTGLAVSMLAARLSWFFNLTGPCVNIDSACSSSMMAFDLACQGLRNGDSNMALVAGANLFLSLDFLLPLGNMEFLSPDSKCFSFDSRANGYGRGEGFGVVILKPLSEALKNGDTIRAVVRSTGSNQDGRTPGITQPSQLAQERLIRDTYEKAGLNLQTTQYIEAHGTGTVLGDPIEAQAIGNAFRKNRSSEEPLYIGAVKSNIGHLEGASGIAGIIKTIMVLESGVIPPNANFEHLNPSIDANFLRIKFPTAITPWPINGLRRASISSFGFGGSNSHAVLDDAYNFLRLRSLAGNHCTAKKPPSIGELDGQSGSSLALSLISNSSQQTGHGECGNSASKLLVLSAADEGGLMRLASAYNLHLSHMSSAMSKDQANMYLENLAYTLAARRSLLPWRSFATTDSVIGLQDLPIKLSKPVKSKETPKLCYVFTGQGAQFAGMSKELLAFPVFMNSLLRSEMYLRDMQCPWSLLDELTKENQTSNINDPEYSQPLCTAVQIAFVDLFKSFGMMPSVLIGHSSGEIAAAYCAGGLSHRSACKVAFFRGHHAASLSRSSHRRGAMVSVGLSKEGISPYLKLLALRFGDGGVVVGCINSPRNVTLTGDESQIDALISLLEKGGVFNRKLKVDVAYHSPHMNTVAADYLQSIQELERGETIYDIDMISTVNGNTISLPVLQQSEYWVKNMTCPVRFSDSLAKIWSSTATENTKMLGANNRGIASVTDILEIGPHSALQGPIKDTLSALGRSDIDYQSAMVRNVSAIDTFLAAAGRLHCAGHAINISEINNPGKEPGDGLLTLPDLPQYPFDHSKSYWHESRLSKEGYRLRQHPRLDLLGTRVPDWNPLEARWRKFMRVSETPWIRDHKINDTIVYPAAGMLVMALEGSKQMAEANRVITGYTIKNVTFHKPLIVTLDSEGAETQLYFRSIRDSSDKSTAWSEFRICTYDGGQWTENCRGNLQVEYEEAPTQGDGGKEAVAKLHYSHQFFKTGAMRCERAVDVKHLYDYLQTCGLDYGPTFQALQNLSYNDQGEARGEVVVFQWSASNNANHPQPHIIHPTTLDAALQVLLLALSKGTEEVLQAPVPTRIEKFWISSSGLSCPSVTTVDVFAHAAYTGIRKAKGTLLVCEHGTGKVMLSMEQLETTNATSANKPSQIRADGNRLCHMLEWKPDIDLLDNTKALEYCENARPNRASPVEFCTGLELVMLKFMSDALDALAEEGNRNSSPYIPDYVNWMKHQVGKFHAGEQKNVSHSDVIWMSLIQGGDYMETLCNAVESANALGRFYVKVGRNLLSMLNGQLDPLTFLFKDNFVSDYYREVNSRVICFEPFAAWLDIISHKNPELNILEIGAGFGTGTKYVLDALAAVNATEGVYRYDHYDYTDISPAFFELAKETYRSQSAKMSFRPLDIEADPLKQGFKAGTYDFVFAGSVLHATKDLEVTMRNVRLLLKPGGKLAMYEITENSMRAGFAFGLLPGWWLSEEKHRRWSPCISAAEWHDILCRTGFSGVDIEIPDFQDSTCHEISILISTAVKPASPPTPPPTVKHNSKPLLIITEHCVLQHEIATELKRYLLTSEMCSCCDIVSLEEASVASDLEEKFCIFLIEIEKPFLSILDADAFTKLQHILTAVSGLLWVTGGGGQGQNEPHFHLVDGLARVLRTEFNNLDFVTLALEKIEAPLESHIRKILHVYKSTLSQSMDDVELEYMENNGMLQIGRVLEANDLNQDIGARTASSQFTIQEFGKGPPLSLNVACPGLLDSLEFLEDSMPSKNLAPGELEMKVKFTGVNFRHCLVALGQIESDVLGGECSGIVSRVGADCRFQPGDHVMACNTTNTYQTYARAFDDCTMKIPDGISFVEASSIPIVFSTAWYALVEIARVQCGETVLIHAGAGGTGQAAVQIAKYLGAEVYTTVGSDAKKELLMELYGIREDHIFNSRNNTSFAQGVMRMTKNRGVDVVLNSLSGDGLVASWECIATFGRFVELGKKDIEAHAKLPMIQFNKNSSFIAVDLSALMRERPKSVQKSLQSVMDLIVARKLHVPQPLKVYGISEVENAFRSLQSGRNSGKMVVEMRDDEIVHTVIPTKPNYQFSENATYLIAGGLGGLGRSAARWMASRGARNLVLLSRSGVGSETAVGFMEELKANGVHAEAPKCDVTSADSLTAVLANCAKTMPPIKGCIQGSMILRDSIFEKMSFEDWSLSVQTKVLGSWNLHNLLPKGMDFFICLSSVASILGSGGQANYASGNSFMDALAHHRVMQGEKATSLNLGWMKSDGVIAENVYLQNAMSATGFLKPIAQDEFYALLDRHCDPNLGLLQSSACQPIIGLETPQAMWAKNAKEPRWMQRKMFRHLRLNGLNIGSNADKSVKAVDYAALVSMAASRGLAARIIVDALVAKLSKAFSISPDDINRSKPLHVVGVDSLLAVELRNYFAIEFSAQVTVFEIMGNISLAEIGAIVANRSTRLAKTVVD